MEIFLPHPHCSWVSLDPVNEQCLRLVKKVAKPLSGAQTLEQTTVTGRGNRGKRKGKEGKKFNRGCIVHEDQAA